MGLAVRLGYRGAGVVKSERGTRGREKDGQRGSYAPVGVNDRDGNVGVPFVHAPPLTACLRYIPHINTHLPFHPSFRFLYLLDIPLFCPPPFVPLLHPSALSLPILSFFHSFSSPFVLPFLFRFRFLLLSWSDHLFPMYLSSCTGTLYELHWWYVDGARDRGCFRLRSGDWQNYFSWALLHDPSFYRHAFSGDRSPSLLPLILGVQDHWEVMGIFWWGLICALEFIDFFDNEERVDWSFEHYLGISVLFKPVYQ